MRCSSACGPAERAASHPCGGNAQPKRAGWLLGKRVQAEFLAASDVEVAPAVLRFEEACGTLALGVLVGD
jgi:hypothetical protein